MNTLVMSGAGPQDDIFTNDRGTWNVTKAVRDCAAGKHGQPWVFDVEPAIAANATVECDQSKITQYAFMPEVLAKPLICVMEDGMAWLIDGHHRLRALQSVGSPEFLAYVIEERYEPQYRVLFNGQRKMPVRV